MYVFNKNLFNCMSTYIPSNNNFPQRNSKVCLVMLETLFVVTKGLVSGQREAADVAAVGECVGEMF